MLRTYNFPKPVGLRQLESFPRRAASRYYLARDRASMARGPGTPDGGPAQEGRLQRKALHLGDDRLLMEYESRGKVEGLKIRGSVA